MLRGGTYLPGNGIRGCGVSVFFVTIHGQCSGGVLRSKIPSWSFQKGIELGVFLPENGIFAEHKVKSVQQVEFL